MTYTVQSRNSLPPVELLCAHCGATWTSTAKDVARCRNCKKPKRIPARLRLQQSSTVTPQLSSTRYPDTPAPRTKPRSVAVQPVSVPAVTVPEPEPDPDDDSDIRNQTYDAIKRAVIDNQAQQLTAPAEIIQQVERTIISVMPDEPTLRYQTGFADYGLMTLRLWSDNEELLMPKIAATVVPALDNVARQIRSFRTEKVQRCDWPDCGARRYVDTPELYTVQSPAFSRQLNLCHRHMMMEVSVIGCNVKVASA